MKTRRSLLFGLGILMTLSLAVPVSAATVNPADVMELEEGKKDTPIEEEFSATEEVIDGQETDEVSSEEEEHNWRWSEVTVNDQTKWQLTDADSEEGTQAPAGIYKVKVGEEEEVFCVDEEGYLLVGVQSVETKEGCPIAENGKYYFTEKGSNPNEDGFGKLIHEDKWVNTKDNKWFKVNANGKVDETKTAWQQVVAGSWYFLKPDGSRDTGKTGAQTIGTSTYFLNADGVPQKGFQKANGQTYYFDAATGVRQNYTGWKKIDGKLYYFNGSYQVANSGLKGWQKIQGSWYFFENGNMATGWRKVSGKWYYMDPTTAVMKTGFFTATDGKKYYCNGSGAMLGGGWNKIGGQWYWMNNSGAIATGWIRPNGKTWYYLRENGTMATGWYKVKNVWYYSNASGAMQTGWKKIGATWYYLGANGAMRTGWYKVGSYWYYSNASGAMQTGWRQIDGKWYYLKSSGAMAANTWISGKYYVYGNGAMAVNTWIGKYYVGADGKWIPNYNPLIDGGKWEKQGNKWFFRCKDGNYLKNRWQKINSKWYYFEPNGVMVTGWKYIGGYKYYFNSNGHLVQDLDGIIGRQSSYYITVNRKKCQVTVYAKDSNGKYIIPVKTFACSVGMPNTPTPVGTFRTPQKLRWHTLMGPSYGQYCTRITGGILFHSVAGSNMTSHNLSAAAYNMLGSPASHGCVRLTVRDAKWIYDNCALGTTVTISDTAATPFDKPATIKIPAWQNWDPTDPAVK